MNLGKSYIIPRNLFELALRAQSPVVAVLKSLLLWIQPNQKYV